MNYELAELQLASNPAVRPWAVDSDWAEYLNGAVLRESALGDRGQAWTSDKEIKCHT